MYDFIELWTLQLNGKILGFLEFLSFNSNVQDSIKWRKEIV